MSGELTIREVAARTGVSEGTLRMWETRYSFPSPERLTSGHRRYSESELEQVRAVVRAREQGLSLRSAIEHARRQASAPQPSVFSALRQGFPHLQPALLPQPALVAISHAIEDESVARGQRPVLIGCFQHERFYRRSEARWRELSRTAEHALVLAEFARPRSRRSRAGGAVEVALPETDPMLREWVLACDAPGFSACLAGWEQLQPAGEMRWFETIWSAEPAVARAAARACLELAARHGEPSPALHQRLEGPAPGSADPGTLTALTTRIVLYATRGG